MRPFRIAIGSCSETVRHIRPAGLLLILLMALSPSLARGQTIERGTLKSLDLTKKVLVVTSEGKDRELHLTDSTRVLDARGTTLAEKLADFKVGAEMQFVAVKRDGREQAEGLRLGSPRRPAERGGRDSGQRGKMGRIDAEKRLVALEVDGKSTDYGFTDETQVLGTRGDSVAARLKTLRSGAEVEFLSRMVEGKPVLIALRSAEARTENPGVKTSPDHAHFKPLTEMGTTKYNGMEGGLYPDGKNDRPTAHEALGLKLAASVVPRDAEGKPAPTGKIVLLSLGMSNTSQLSQGFARHLQTAEGVNSRFQFLDGAQGGMTAEVIKDPQDNGRGSRYWQVVDERLKQANLTRQQVQVIWIKQADAGPTQGFPEYPKKLQGELKAIVHIVADRFPNAKLCYLSSRTYGGFATTRLNPEPVAYESGFAVKWLIEEQLRGAADLNCDADKGAVKAPWLAWGPYLWANGTTKRTDGFAYEESDFSGDGTHHSNQGQRKTSELLLKFLQNDTTSKLWFAK